MSDSDAPAADQVGEWDRNPEGDEWKRPWVPRFLEALAVSPNVTAAARHAGVSERTAHVARAGGRPEKREYAEPGLAEAWAEAAHRSAITNVEHHLWLAGTVGIPYERTTHTVKRDSDGKIVEETTVTIKGKHRSNIMAARWLKAHHPAKWGDQVAHVHAGPDGGPIRHEHQPSELTVEDVAKLLVLFAEKRPDLLALTSGNGRT